MGVALSRDIVDTVLLPAYLHYKWILLVDLGERANAVGREELLLVKKVLEHAGETLFGWDGQQVTELTLIQSVKVRNLDIKCEENCETIHQKNKWRKRGDVIWKYCLFH